MLASTRKSLAGAVAALCVAWLVTPVAAEATTASAPCDSEGTIRVWASPQDAKLLGKWETGFRELQPRVRFENIWHGPESTLAGVYAGVADVALMARELRRPVEQMAFQWVFRHLPFAITVPNAGFSAVRESAQLALFVHADNPLARVTLAQLGQALGADAEPAPIFRRSWFQRRRLGRRPENARRNRQRSARDRLCRMGLPQRRRQADGAGRNRRRALRGADARKRGRSSYPLKRFITMFYDGAPGKLLDPKLAEFLRYVLSGDGQREVIEHGHGYLPMPTALAKHELAKLEGKK